MVVLRLFCGCRVVLGGCRVNNHITTKKQPSILTNSLIINILTFTVVGCRKNPKLK